MTVEARALPDGRTLAGFYITSSPAIPVVSKLLGPLIGRTMIRNIHKDIAALKAYCESKSHAMVEAGATGRLGNEVEI